MRGALLAALDSLFGEFLNAEGINEVDAASICYLHTFRTISPNAFDQNVC